MKKIIMFVCLFVFFISGPVYAGTAPELLKAIDQIYASSFSSARKTVTSYIDAHPEDPAGYMVRGMLNEWYQLAKNKGKKLNSEIMSDYQKARILADDALEKDSKNLDKKMMLGNAYMYVAKKQIDTGHKMQSGFSLKQAKNLMNEVIAKDPGNNEAYFAVGLFNYFAANVPSGFKWLANILGFKGSESKGFQYILKAASAKNLTQNDAKYMLFHIYSQREGNYAKAYTYAKSLHRRFPSNVIFTFDHAEMLFRTKKITQARAEFNNFFKQIKKGRGNKELEFLANYFMAWSYMNEKDYKNAKPYLKKAIKLDTKRFKDRTADMQKWEKKM